MIREFMGYCLHLTAGCVGIGIVLIGVVAALKVLFYLYTISGGF